MSGCKGASSGARGGSGTAAAGCGGRGGGVGGLGTGTCMPQTHIDLKRYDTLDLRMSTTSGTRKLFRYD